MYKTILISCIGTAALVFLTAVTSGSTISGLLDVPLFSGMLLFAVPVLAAAGSLRDFCTAFALNARKTNSVAFTQLQDCLEAVRLVIKTELLLGATLWLAAFVTAMYNWQTIVFTGPNLFVFFAAPLYAFLFALWLYPAETALKRRIYSYLDEDETESDSAAPRKEPPETSGTSSGKAVFWVKVLIFVLLAGGFARLSGTSLKNSESIPLPVDLPSILGIAFFVCVSLAASGSFRDIGFFFRRRENRTGRHRKALFEAIDLTGKTLVTSGGMMTLINFIGVLNNLADKAVLVPNAYVALIPAGYGFVFALILLPFRSRLKKER